MQFSQLSARFDVPSSRAWDVHYEALRRRQAGQDVIVLSIGDHEFDTPEPTVSAAVASLRSGRHHYTPAAGEPWLRQAVAAYHRRITGQNVSVANVVILPGAQCGLFVSGLCLFNPGDDLLVPDPMYTTYRGTIQASGARICPIPLRRERDFELDPADVGRAIGDRTRGILLNSPHNPTGAVLSRGTLEAIADLAGRHDLWLLSDEVYATMTFDAEHICPATLPGMAERTVVINSMSKSHAMTGWRIGWVVVHECHAHHFQELANYILFGLPPFVQDAAAAALDDDTIPAAIRNRYRARRDLVCSRLGSVTGLRFHPPAGSMFLMIDVATTGLDDYEFARRLLHEHGVAVLPGSGFGESGAGHIRLSLSAGEAELAEACERIARFVKGLRLEGQRSGALPCDTAVSETA